MTAERGDSPSRACSSSTVGSLSVLDLLDELLVERFVKLQDEQHADVVQQTDGDGLPEEIFA